MGYTRSEQVVAFAALYGGDEPFNNSNEYMWAISGVPIAFYMTLTIFLTAFVMLSVMQWWDVLPESITLFPNTLSKVVPQRDGSIVFRKHRLLFGIFYACVVGIFVTPQVLFQGDHMLEMGLTDMENAFERLMGNNLVPAYVRSTLLHEVSSAHLEFLSDPDNFGASGSTAAPTGQPSALPTGVPTGLPSGMPSGMPSGIPSGMPSGRPTAEPPDPSIPSSSPSSEPTSAPTGQPTGQPTGAPSGTPSGMPSRQPTSQPTQEDPDPGIPSNRPSSQPTGIPTTPTGEPTGEPTGAVFVATAEACLGLLEPSFIVMDARAADLLKMSDDATSGIAHYSDLTDYWLDKPRTTWLWTWYGSFVGLALMYMWCDFWRWRKGIETTTLFTTLFLYGAYVFVAAGLVAMIGFSSFCMNPMHTLVGVIDNGVGVRHPIDPSVSGHWADAGHMIAAFVHKDEQGQYCTGPQFSDPVFLVVESAREATDAALTIAEEMRGGACAWMGGGEWAQSSVETYLEGLQSTYLALNCPDISTGMRALVEDGACDVVNGLGTLWTAQFFTVMLATVLVCAAAVVAAYFKPVEIEVLEDDEGEEEARRREAGIGDYATPSKRDAMRRAEATSDAMFD